MNGEIKAKNDKLFEYDCIAKENHANGFLFANGLSSLERFSYRFN